MSQPIQGFFLDLTNSFTGDVKSFADLFQGVFRFFANTEPQPDNFLFPIGQGGQHLSNPMRQFPILNRIIR